MRHLLPFTLLLAACPFGPTSAPEDFSACDADDGHDLSIGGLDSGSSGVSVDGDTLSVTVGYGGGCEEHLFAICWPDQTFMESDPVQVDLEIWHGGKPDMCEAYLTSTLEFDLSPLKAAWKDAYGNTAGTIVIHVEGASESVEYSFE